jgi:hypothetical protein
MGDQRDAAGPEARVFRCAGDLLAKLGRELAMNGRGVHADFFEHPAMHHAHHAAAALGARMVGALPGLANKPPRRVGALWQATGQVVFNGLEGCADPIAQGFKPGARGVLAGRNEAFVGHDQSYSLNRQFRGCRMAFSVSRSKGRNIGRDAYRCAVAMEPVLAIIRSKPRAWGNDLFA